MKDPSAGTHADRHSSAIEVFMGMKAMPEELAERAYRSAWRKEAALGSFSFDLVMGEVWSREELGRRDRSLIVLAALATLQSDEELNLHLEIAFNHGVTRSEIDEVWLHVAALAGFPRARRAARLLNEVATVRDGVDRPEGLLAAEPLDDEERRERAERVRRELWPDEDPTDDCALTRLAERWLFGEVWPRTALDSRPRALVTIAVLVSLEQWDELAGWAGAATRVGLTHAELHEACLHLFLYVGLPAAQRAGAVLRGVLCAD